MSVVVKTILGLGLLSVCVAQIPFPMGMGLPNPQQIGVGMPTDMGAMPGMGMPMMGMPMMGMPNMGMPAMGMPAMGMPNMGMPAMGMPNMGMPGMGAPSAMPGLGFPMPAINPQQQTIVPQAQLNMQPPAIQPIAQPVPQTSQPTGAQPVPQNPDWASIFGLNRYGGLGGYPNWFGQNSALASTPAKPQENYLWVCLEDIFPKDVRMAAGIPDSVGDVLASYATHAYILHGPDVNSAVGWQVTLNEGAQYWNRVLVEAKKMDMNRPLDWAKEKASQVVGNTRISTAPGSQVFRNSRQCYKSTQPTKCSSGDMRSLSDKYLHDHPRFNLASENCVAYACTMLHSCSTKEESSCNLDSCKKNVMFNKMEEKSPTCGTELVMSKKESPQLFQVNPLAAFGFNFQMKPVDPPEQLRDFMPMHFSDAKRDLAKLLVDESKLQ